MKVKVTRSSDIAKKPVEMEGAEGVEIRWLISKDDGAGNFAMRMFEVRPGGCTPLHRHPHEHEVFVLAGEGVFVCEGQEYPFGGEYVIFVPGGEEQQFRNTGEGTLRFLCLIPGSGV